MKKQIIVLEGDHKLITGVEDLLNNTNISENPRDIIHWISKDTLAISITICTNNPKVFLDVINLISPYIKENCELITM